jgi:PAS domain-containing protein
MLRAMILRITAGALPPGIDAAALLALRGRLARAAHEVAGLESLVFGMRPSEVAEPEAAFVTVWRDADAMARATSPDEQQRFLDARLGLPIALGHSDHFEIVARSFAALPPESTVYIRLVTVRARPNEEARMVETLRDQQPRLVERGLVASHVGRRVVDRDVEAVTVGVWPDRATAAGREDLGAIETQPFFPHELEPWMDGLHVRTYEGIEIAPRLPTPAGPPVFVFDDELRIVDVTPAAAARLGRPAEELVGMAVRELSVAGSAVVDERFGRLQRDGTASGESAWAIPDAGRVYLRYVARRDVPVPGRHVAFVRRRHEPQPGFDELDAAVAEAFPAGAE